MRRNDTAVVACVMRDNENYWKRLRRRPVTRRSFLIGSGLAAAGSAAILAGCGDDDDDDGAAAPAATQAAATQAAAATAAAEESQEEAVTEAEPDEEPEAVAEADPNAPRPGGRLRMWKPEEDAGLDPGIFHVNNTEVLYSTMTQPYTYQPTKNIFAMDGMVGFEQVDSTTLVWSIRPGMKFHNGDPVNSESVAFSFGRLTKLYDALDGTHTTRTGFSFVDSFDATDELTVTEHWSRPNADAPVYRARHYYSFLNPRIVEQYGLPEGSITLPDGTTEEVLSVQELPHGSGSGPYMLTERDATGTRVERWPDYHKHTPADDGFVEDGPYIDAWETRIIPDKTAAKAAFLAGDIDVFSSIDPLELPEFEGLDHINAVEVPAGGFAGQGMDGGKFHDPRSRRALQKAFDYEGFISAIRPLGGKYAAPVSDLLSGYQKLGQQDLQEWLRHDPQEARQLWEAADFIVPVEKTRSSSRRAHRFSSISVTSWRSRWRRRSVSRPRSRPWTRTPGPPALSIGAPTSRTGRSSATAMALPVEPPVSPTTPTSSTTTRAPTGSTPSTTTWSPRARRSPKARRPSLTC